MPARPRLNLKPLSGMHSSSISTTVALTGVLPFVVLLAAALAFPLCLWLLRLYRRSVLKAMSLATGEVASAAASAAAPHAPLPPANVQTLTRTSPLELGSLDRSDYRQAALGLWQAGAVYAVAGLAYALVMTAGWLLATHDATIVWTKLLLLCWTYLWPAVLSVLLVAAYDGRRRRLLLWVYFGAFAAMATVAVARNPDLGVGDLPLYWLLMNAPSSVLLLAFLARGIRAVGPVVLAFLLLAVMGSQVVLSVAAADEAILRGFVQLGSLVGLGARGIFVGMILLGMLLFAAIAWPVLRWVGRRYQQKKLSDQSITLDSLWLLFAVVQSIGLAFEAPAWVLTGIVAFAGYKAVSALGFRLLARAVRAKPARVLLLLRVFALGERSERLFDKLRKHWQRVGSISMIAGPDLVTTTVEPHEFLDFLSGRLSRHFVQDRADLDRRIAAMDRSRDPDGRYRVNEFFCRASTWQMTMQRLASASDAVLMDLRSFSQANQGCIFELERLLDAVDLDHVVFLIDDTTQRSFLESTLQQLWQQMGPESPNRQPGASQVRLFRIREQSEPELRVLLQLLLGAMPADQVNLDNS